MQITQPDLFPVLSATKSGTAPSKSLTKSLSVPAQSNSEVSQNRYSVSACFGSLIILSFSRVHAYSTKTWRPTLFKALLRERGHQPSFSPCRVLPLLTLCVLLSQLHSLPSRDLEANGRGGVVLSLGTGYTVWMSQEGQAQKEKDFISTRRNKESSTEKQYLTWGLKKEQNFKTESWEKESGHWG